MNDYSNTERKQILIVDDEKAFRKFLKESLEAYNHSVIEADEVDSALEMFSKYSIDLVVSDIKMPGKTGVDLLREVKTQHPSIPVIVITGLPDVDAAVTCMKYGAFDYVAKPVDIEKLIESVTKALSHSIHSATETPAIVNSQGQTVSGYRILKTLGEGNMGIVFLVNKMNDKGMQEKYALKIVKMSYSKERNKRLLKRFFNEIEVISKLNHTNIVKVIEHGYSKEMQIPYYVMEYIDGKSLKSYIKNKTELSTMEKAKIIRQIASALIPIHANEICHRDIKPDNILITKDKTVKLMDFGVAQVPDSDITQTQHT